MEIINIPPIKPKQLIQYFMTNIVFYTLNGWYYYACTPTSQVMCVYDMSMNNINYLLDVRNAMIDEIKKNPNITNHLKLFDSHILCNTYIINTDSDIRKSYFGEIKKQNAANGLPKKIGKKINAYMYYLKNMTVYKCDNIYCSNYFCAGVKDTIANIDDNMWCLMVGYSNGKNILDAQFGISGSINKNESTYDAIIRELMEEANIKISCEHLTLSSHRSGKKASTVFTIDAKDCSKYKRVDDIAAQPSSKKKVTAIIYGTIQNMYKLLPYMFNNDVNEKIMYYVIIRVSEAKKIINNIDDKNIMWSV